jgi:predicted nuclease of predicted toxin-antitoxin system
VNFRIDENLPIEAADVLRGAGHDAVSVLEQSLGGAADPVIAAICESETRVLVTLDADFADIRAYPPANYPGLIVLRLNQQGKTHVLEILRRLVFVLVEETPEGHLWIVEQDRIRVRD